MIIFKKIIPAVLFAVLLTSFHTLAQGSLPQIAFDAENLCIDLKWDASELSEKVITVTVDDGNGVLSSDNYPEFAWVYPVPEDKQVDLDILLPTEMDSGTYYVYVDTKTQHHVLESYIHNIHSNAVKDICIVAYGFDNADDFKTYAVPNADSLGLNTDNEIISANIKRACGLLFYEMSRHQSQSPLAVNGSARAVTGFVLLGGGANPDEVVKSYGDVLGIDEAAFAKKTEAVKAKFASLIAAKDNRESDIESIVGECLMLASLTDAENWNSLRECITENADTIGIDMGEDSEFATIPSKRQYEVFVKLFETSSGLESYSEFVDDFNSAVEFVTDKIDSENKKGSGSVGGSGGGKSSSSSVAVSGDFLDKPVTPAVPQVQTPVFSDIQGHFAEEYINELIKYNAINGYEDGTFRPNGSVTRAEFVAMAVRTFSVSPSSTGAAFSDVAPQEWYYSAITAMASNNIITGYNGRFSPNSYITRQEAAVILSRLMTFRKYDAGQVALDYSDTAAIDNWARDAVGKLTASGVMQGDNNKFRPLDSITRGETAAVIARLAGLPGMIAEVTK